MIIKKFITILTTIAITLTIILGETPFSLSTKVNAQSDPENLIFDISEGSIIVNADTVTYGTPSSTQSYNSVTDTIIITGTTTKNAVTIKKDVSVNIILRDVNIDVSAYIYSSSLVSSDTAFTIEDNSLGDVNITLEGNNVLKSSQLGPGLRKNDSTADCGWLTFNGTGSLTIEGRVSIGYNSFYENKSNIAFNGGVITAEDGIGLSYYEPPNIVINGGSIKLDYSTTVYYTDSRLCDVIKNENGDKVYLLELTVGNNVESILIDNKSYPTNHNTEGKIYAWLPGESHEVIINDNIVKHYNFDTELKRFVSAEESKFIVSATNDTDILVDGEDYTYENNILTILSEKPITIANVDPMIATITDTIIVKKDISANITLNGINIEAPLNTNKAAFEIENDSVGNVTVTLANNTINTLKSNVNYAGLQKNGDVGTGILKIDGEGTLYASSSDKGAGIGSGMGYNASNISINNGVIIVNSHCGACIGSGSYGSDINGRCGGNGSNITINGGTIIAKNAMGAGINAEGATGACIGGGLLGNGTNIVINDGNITAIQSYQDRGGACIGGGSEGNGTDITINGGTIITRNSLGAGIGGGTSGGDGTNIIINDGNITTILNSYGAGIGGNITIIFYTGSSGAGIGGGDGGSGSNITIRDGIINAISKYSNDYTNNWAGACIGGGYKGNGTDITISGGIIDVSEHYNNISIGNGERNTEPSTFSTVKENGTLGDAWIETNNITDNADTSNWSGIIFQGNEGKVYGNQTLNVNREVQPEKTLTIPTDASLTLNKDISLTVNSTLTNEGVLLLDKGTLEGYGVLDGNGQFLTTTLTSDLINVPTDLYYTRNNYTDYITENTSLKPDLYWNKEFQVIGWTLQSVVQDSDLEYTVTYISDDIEDVPVTKPVIVLQSGTILTANFLNDKTDYIYGDNIIINGTVDPTGEAPVVAMLLAEPSPGQVVAYKDDIQVSEPVTPDSEGNYSLTVPTLNVGTGNHTLTIKYIESIVMAQETLDIDANVTLPEGIIEANNPIFTFETILTTNKTDTILPTTTFIFDISPASEGELNSNTKSGVGTPIIDNVMFTNADVFTDKSISKDTTVDFTDTSFTTIGIYRYVLQESLNEETSGLVVDNEKRYLDVYIENTVDGSLKIAYYMLSTESGTKTNSFNNQYDVFDLTIDNTVTGASGDKLKDFIYTVIFDDTTIKNVNIIANDITTNDNMTYTFLLKNNENVIFKNIPKNAKYTITESGNSRYITTINKIGTDIDNVIYNDVSTFSDLTDGITNDTQVRFTNNRDSIVPTGINLEILTPITIGIIVVSIIMFILLKRNDYTDIE